MNEDRRLADIPDEELWFIENLEVFTDYYPPSDRRITEPQYYSRVDTKAILDLTGYCPQCGASHANESVCHSCDYDFSIDEEIDE